jgi:iron complex outermembrane receptor protein
MLSYVRLNGTAMILLLSYSLWGQPVEFATDTVPLLSTRLPQTMAQTGRQVSLLTAQDIARLPVQTVDELLRYVSGVEVQARGPLGAQADILMRGSTFSQVLMLIDGMRLNDPLTGHFNAALPVSVAEIARIEVLRGPAAALYGPDAVGGVIHIITKTFDPLPSSDGSSANLSLGQGLQDLDRQQDRAYLLSAQGGGHWQRGPFQVGGGFTLNRSNGEALPPDSLAQRNDVDVRTLSLSGRYALGRGWSAMLRAAYDERTFNAFRYYTLSPADRAREQTRQGWLQGRLAHQGATGQTTLDVAYKVMRDSFLFNPAFPANLHTTQYANLQLHHVQPLGTQLDLAGGGQLDQRRIESSDRGQHLSTHVGAYLMAFYRPWDQAALTASLRGDYDENYGVELIPQLNASYCWPTLTVRAASGRSTRAADFTERYIGYNLPAPIAPGRNLGNPSLQAERAWSHEVGGDWTLWPGIRLSGTAFYRQGRDLIDYVLRTGADLPRPERAASDSALYLLAENIASVNTYGLETEASVIHYWSDQRSLDLRAGALWVQSDTKGAPPSKYLANHARLQLNARMRLQWDRVALSSTCLFKQRAPDQTTVLGTELAAQYFVWSAKVEAWERQRRTSIWLQVNNVLDTRYQDILGAYLPGRWVWAGINWLLQP